MSGHSVAQILPYGVEKTTNLTAGAHKLGAVVMGAAGGLFVRALAGEAIARGKLAMQIDVIADHDLDLVTVAAAVGAVQVSVTLGATAVVKNEYAGGFLIVNDEAGEGQMFRIRSHPAADASAAVVITLEPNDPIKVALTSASQVGLRHNPYRNVALYDGDDVDGAPAGWALVDVASGSYCWLKVQGVVPVLAVGTLVLGRAVAPSASVDGAVDTVNEDGTVDQLRVGTVLTVAAAGEYGLIVADLPVMG